MLLDVFPIDGRACAGCLIAGENGWTEGKQEVTGRACAAVARRVINNGGTLIVHDDQGPRYELTTKKARL
jgi:hypothetical protein